MGQRTRRASEEPEIRLLQQVFGDLDGAGHPDQVAAKGPVRSGVKLGERLLGESEALRHFGSGTSSPSDRPSLRASLRDTLAETRSPPPAARSRIPRTCAISKAG